MHSAWKLWLHWGNILHLSPTLKLSKQIAQSTGVLVPFSLAWKMKQGSFSISSLDMDMLVLPLSAMLMLSLLLLNSLTSTQIWIRTRTPTKTNSDSTDITIARIITRVAVPTSWFFIVSWILWKISYDLRNEEITCTLQLLNDYFFMDWNELLYKIYLLDLSL